MLSLCQWATDLHLFDMSIINDAAQGGVYAVQCGNEQMKGANITATRRRDLCQILRFVWAGHARCTPGIPSLLVPLIHM